MLRVMVLALALLNLVYLAWGQGWLLPYGMGPVSQREPQRLAMQIRPQAIELLTAKEAEQLLLASTTPLPCWQAGLFDEAQMRTLREALTANLPEGAWLFELVTQPETGYRLLLPSVNETLQQQLTSIQPALADKALMPCQPAQ